MDVTVVPLHVRYGLYLLLLKKNGSMLKENKAEQKLEVGHFAGGDKEVV